MKSFLKPFTRLAEQNKGILTLTADCMLVEILKDEDLQKTKSGIILADTSKEQVNGVYADRPTFARVLMTGEGWDKSDGSGKIPLDSKPGDIVLAGKHSFKRFSMFGKLAVSDAEICLMKDSDVQMRFHGEAAYNKAFDILDSYATNSDDAQEGG